MLTVRDVLDRNGVKVRRNGFISCPFHSEKTASMKIYPDSFYCFGCGKSGDIFDMEMQLAGCDFRTAFELLGGGRKPSWRATVVAAKAKRARQAAEEKRQADKLRIRSVNMYITAYRELIKNSEPFSDDWCYYADQLTYKTAELEEILELGE